MARMRTLLLYALGIIGFMFLSYILEDGLIQGMYVPMTGNASSAGYNIEITDVNASASNVNGYMQFKLTNKSSEKSNCYMKIDLISEQGLLAATKYVEIKDLEPGQSKDYQVKFKGSEISNYNLNIISEAPDKSNILNLFGWEIDLTDVFGMDLSNTTIFGVKLTELFTWDSAKTAAGNAWDWSLKILESVPWWGYAIGAGIVIWYLPAGYLFGII